MTFSSKTDAIISDAIYCTSAPAFPSDDPDMERRPDADLIDDVAAYRRAVVELEMERTRLDRELRLYRDLIMDLNEAIKGDDTNAFAKLLATSGVNDRFFQIGPRQYIRCRTAVEVKTIETEYLDDATARWAERPISGIIEFARRPSRVR